MNIEEKLALILRNSKTLRNYKWALRMLKSTAGNKDSYDVFDALKAIEAQKKPSSKQTLYYMLKKFIELPTGSGMIPSYPYLRSLGIKEIHQFLVRSMYH